MSCRIHALSRLKLCAGSTLLLAGTLAPGRAQTASLRSQLESPERPGAKAAPIAITVATNKKIYSHAEPIVMTLTAHASGKRAVHITFPSSQKFDFEIRRGVKGDKPLVWRWSEGRVFMTMLTGDTLEPGKPQTFRTRFETVVDKAGKRVPLIPGDYIVTGTLNLLQQAPQPVGTTSFRVR